MENGYEERDSWYAQKESAESYTPKPTAKKKKERKWLKITALVLVCALVGALAGAGGAALVKGQEEPKASTAVYESKRETKNVDTALVDTDKLMSASEVYAQNVGSTVGIKTSLTTNFWGYRATSSASGSGFILTEDGYIITNYHVIEDSDSVEVSLYDGSTCPAEIIGYDQNNDVAVLKIEASGLVPVVLGSSDALLVGDGVVAIGNPLGELTFSLTGGIVSALNRSIAIESGRNMNLIQTDCAINSGNSGGALFNMYGEVVGITNAKYSSSSSGASVDNICFAIPIDDVRPIVRSIIENGYIVRPYIGVSVRNVSSEAQRYGMPAGASVDVVAEGGPAEKAGVQVNDIITAVNGEAITGSADLTDLVGSCRKGDVLELTIYRQGSTVTLTLTVDEQQSSALEKPEQQTQQQIQTMPYDEFEDFGGFGGFGGGFPWSFFGF